MASQPERIAWGSLSGTSEVTVYTVPRQTRVVLASLILTNRGSENASVSAYVTVEDAAYNVLPSGLQLGAGDSYHLTTPMSARRDSESERTRREPEREP